MFFINYYCFLYYSIIYYVIDYDSIQYKGGPYKTIYIANIECAKHLYLLNNLEEEPVIA